MQNIYFPDEEITINDLYFVCYMIERTARKLKQHNKYVVNALGKENLVHQLSVANVMHCKNPEEVVYEWTTQYNLQSGNFDITNVDKTLAEIIPTELQMGKVYQRLIVDTLQPGEDYADGILKIYNSWICEKIDNYNCSAFYEPSYYIARAFENGGF
ncbi:hypothetical protein [Hallerella porci]|uniref:Uncharacterized protein n=1 Tax=Hallerella porci TaxID=1945871 RepID=A0ABX5LMF4_9BACT|nr:hypothetical protein [Hallerella porci]PWK93152.1 hypothetical protein B0H50_13122 [Hallerella porci]